MINPAEFIHPEDAAALRQLESILWPVLLTQIWGMVDQSKLDDKALEIAEGVVYMNSNTGAASASSAGSKFCTSCGTQNAESANFCSGCGKPL